MFPEVAFSLRARSLFALAYNNIKIKNGSGSGFSAMLRAQLMPILGAILGPTGWFPRSLHYWEFLPLIGVSEYRGFCERG